MKLLQEILQEIDVELTHFPLLIRTEQGKRIICSRPEDLPAGVPFIVLETRCDIEIRYLPAMYTYIP